MNTEYVLIDINDTVIETRNFNSDGMDEIVTKPGFLWVEVLPYSIPEYDPSKFRLRESSYTIDREAKTATKNYNLIELSEQEISDILAGKVALIDPILQQVILYLENRLNVIEGLSEISKSELLEKIKSIINV